MKKLKPIKNRTDFNLEKQKQIKNRTDSKSPDWTPLAGDSQTAANGWDQEQQAVKGETVQF